MASQGLSRKRPAPGTSPVSYPQQMQNPTASTFADGIAPQLSDDQFLQWGQTGQNNPSQYNENSYAMNSNTYPQANPQPSNQLTRRPMTQLTTRGRIDEDPASWVDGGTAPPTKPDPEWSDDIADLEAKAQVAKREAQGKRKQIPPFVQKLNR
jgi:heat shock transcription factor